MAETEEISYTPEELGEIERILDLIERSGSKPLAARETAAPSTAVAEAEEAPPVEEEFHAAPEKFEEPEDLALPAGDLERLTEEKKPAEETYAEEEAPIEDITGLIHEVEEGVPERKGVPRALREEESAAVPVERGEKPEGMSPADELEFLTAGEPESLDHQDRAPIESYVEEREAPRRAEAKPVQFEETPVFEDLDLGEQADLEMKDIGVPEEKGKAAVKPAKGVTLEKEMPQEIPDLSEISFDEGKVEMPEVRDIESRKWIFPKPLPKRSMFPPRSRI